jgi:hypothetical protein
MIDAGLRRFIVRHSINILCRNQPFSQQPMSYRQMNNRVSVSARAECLAQTTHDA